MALFGFSRFLIVLTLSAGVLFSAVDRVGAEPFEAGVAPSEAEADAGASGGGAQPAVAVHTPSIGSFATAAFLPVLVPAEATDTAFTPWPETGVETAQACCRICRQGKACGNSCINRQLRCHQPPGCACDG